MVAEIVSLAWYPFTYNISGADGILLCQITVTHRVTNSLMRFAEIFVCGGKLWSVPRRGLADCGWDSVAPSQESGVQLDHLPRAGRNQRGGADGLCRAHRVKGESILIWKRSWLIISAQEQLLHCLSLSEWAQVVISDWEMGLEYLAFGLGMFT